MTRAIIRHLSGSKSHQVEEHPLEGVSSLTIGRDSSAAIRFHPDRDDLVSREHARIEWDPGNGTKLRLVDLGSRNGTLLNKVPVKGTTELTVGDVIQLGPGGPEFQFDLEPPPRDVVRATRVAESSTVAPTRAGGATKGSVSSGASTAGPRTTVGRETVERMIAVQRQVTRRSFVTGAAALLAVIVLVTGYAVYSSTQQGRALTDQLTQQQGTIAKWDAVLTPANIHELYAGAVVYIDVGWKVVESGEGQLYHLHLRVPEKLGDVCYPVYRERSEGGPIEPVLVHESAGGCNRAIGGNHQGSGFVVSSDGFIMTNKHVAAPWQVDYEAPLASESGRPGAVLLPANKKPRLLQPKDLERLHNIPPARMTAPKGKRIEGIDDRLDVYFPKSNLRLTARLIRDSDRHDVALIKVDVPTSVPMVKLEDNHETIQAGDAVTVMGYPGVSRQPTFLTASKNPLQPGVEERRVPEPTTSTGNIGLVGLAREKTPGDDVRAIGWDIYQLTVNSTGAGNSGGPVFDDHGRVIAIFYAGTRQPVGGAMVTLAVPIKYGLELMGMRQVLQ